MWRYDDPVTEEQVMRMEVTPAAAPGMSAKLPLTIDEEESPEQRIERLISENPVVIFSRSSCYMCHVMKKLLSTIGVHPTVIELEEGEIDALAVHHDSSTGEAAAGAGGGGGGGGTAPVVFIGGESVGGLDRLIALHLSGNLIPKLREVGALWA